MVAREELTGFQPLKDPMIDLMKRKSEIDRTSANPYPNKMMDEKELADREEAAKAYAGENEQHFVDYAEDCKNQSRKSSEDIRSAQAACWSMYNEEEPSSYAQKEEWQAKMKAETSFDAIRTKLNTEMSALNTEKMQADADRILKGKTTAKIASRVEPTVTPVNRLATKTQLS